MAASLAEAASIRDECAAAKSALQNAWTLAANSNTAFWSALHDSEAHVDEARRLASSAAWPAELASQKSALISALNITRTNLAHLDDSPRRWKTSQIRSILDPELSRLASVTSQFDALVPPPATTPPSPAPTPEPTPAPTPDPTPAPTPAPTPDPAPSPTPEPTPAPPGTIPTLVGGSGFTAATPQPDAVGSGLGADAQAIARWDVVPFQTVATKIPVGVVAFHMAGIESVDFSVNGGPWSRVTEMTQNPLTLVWEYSAWIDPAALADGLVEVRAVARPKKGLARVLAGPIDEGAACKGRGEHSLVLYANSKGTLPSRSVWVDSVNGNDTTGDGTETRPYKDLNEAYRLATVANADVSGLTVFLKTGDYAWPYSWAGFKDNAQYVTVAGAPGQARTAARITYADQDHNRGLDARHVCLRNLTIASTTIGNETKGGMVWSDGCELMGTARTDYPWTFPEPQWGLGIWLTKPVIHSMGFATSEYRFLRDYEIYDIGEDSIRDLCGFAINGYVHDTRYGKSDVHADLIQFFDGMGASGQFENVAVYGLRTRRIGAAGEGVQGLFIRNYYTVPAHEDLAFVNCDLEFAGNSQILHSVNHLLIWHCNFMPNPATGTGGSLLLADDPPDSPETRLHDFSLRNSVLNYFSDSCSTEAVMSSPAGGETWADGNHVVQGPAVGTNVTGGGSLSDLFVDWTHGDYTPSPVSVLVGRLGALLVPGDVNGRARSVPDYVGANVPAAK